MNLLRAYPKLISATECYFIIALKNIEFYFIIRIIILRNDEYIFKIFGIYIFWVR